MHADRTDLIRVAIVSLSNATIEGSILEATITSIRNHTKGTNVINI